MDEPALVDELDESEPGEDVAGVLDGALVSEADELARLSVR
ncbi:MAG TPA: hypothetical protein VGL26_10220 [Jatrophihabitans sp.]